MLNLECLQPGATQAIELDVTEQYGNDPKWMQAVEHHWVNGSDTGGGYIYHNEWSQDLTWEFHRYGMLITDTTVSYYFDDQLLGSLPKSSIPGVPTPTWFSLLDLAMGGGWPDVAPQGNYYDMWIDYVRYYR